MSRASINPNRKEIAAGTLAEVWEQELEPMLQREPRIEATTLYEYLEERYPGEYGATLRTVQRRVQAWKAAHGAPQEVMFELHHAPGVVGHSDFTEVKQVSITIGGQPFEHLLYHYRLAHSGWQYVQVIQGGESFVALAYLQGRHVYSDAAFITPELMQAKHHTTQFPGARFASVAFVTGGLDPVQRRTDWLDLVESVTVPKLAIAGHQTPPKSGAEMEMLKAMAGVQWATVPGSLAAHEEYPEAVLESLMPFLEGCWGG